MSLDDYSLDDVPLDYKPSTVSFPQISDEMVSSIALGMEDELVVAARHGLSIEKFKELEAQPWFQLQVQVRRSEYEKNGVTFKAKAAWMAGELLDQVYVQAASADASLNQKHDILKTLIKAAGLEPKEEKVRDVGPGFSISIDLGGGHSVSLSNQQGLAPVTHVPVTLDAEVKEIR